MPATGDRKALIYSGVLTGTYFVIELAIGLWSGSIAVISDAFHTFSAVGGVLIALVAQRLSERPATREHTFGWVRAEIIGALFNGLFLVVMAAYVLWMGAMRLMEPMEPSTTLMLSAAFGGIATELIAFWLLYERQKGNLNMKGAFWHILQTFVGSLIIIVSALVIRFTGFSPSIPFSAWRSAWFSSGPRGSLSDRLCGSCCRARRRASTSKRPFRLCRASKA